MNGILRGFAVFMAAPLLCQVAPRALAPGPNRTLRRSAPASEGRIRTECSVKTRFSVGGSAVRHGAESDLPTRSDLRRCFSVISEPIPKSCMF